MDSILKLQLLNLLVQVLLYSALLALAFALVKWQQKRLRTMLLIAFVVLGVPGAVLMVYSFVKAKEETDTLFANFAKPKVVEQQNEPQYNTYYIDRLKALVPDSLQNSFTEDFYTYYGYAQAWRYPMVYPYDIRTADVEGTCRLGYDAPDNVGITVVPDVVKFNFDKRLFLAQVLLHKTDTAYTIYHLWTGEEARYKTWDECLTKAKAMRYRGETTLMTVKEYSSNFTAVQ